MSLTIALDFDGVLHSYKRGYTGPIPLDPPVEGAVAFVDALVARDYKVFIFTARIIESGPDKYIGPDCIPERKLAHAGIQQWLKHWGFPSLEVTGMKKHADLYIDDRGFRFEGDFDTVIDFLQENSSAQTWQKTIHKAQEE
jgi:hypothetical protein